MSIFDNMLKQTDMQDVRTYMSHATNLLIDVFGVPISISTILGVRCNNDKTTSNDGEGEHLLKTLIWNNLKTCRLVASNKIDTDAQITSTKLA